MPSLALRDRCISRTADAAQAAFVLLRSPWQAWDLPGWVNPNPRLLRLTASWPTASARSISKTRMSPVTRAELEAVTNAFARTLARYVPAEKLDEAEAFMRSELGLVGGNLRRASLVDDSH